MFNREVGVRGADAGAGTGNSGHTIRPTRVAFSALLCLVLDICGVILEVIVFGGSLIFVIGIAKLGL